MAGHRSIRSEQQATAEKPSSKIKAVRMQLTRDPFQHPFMSLQIRS